MIERIKLATFVLFLAGAAVAAPARGSEATMGPIWIGVVREDGFLLPVARLKSGTWSTPWPEAQRDLDSPVFSGLQVPSAWVGGDSALPEKWRLHPSQDAPVLLRASAVKKIESHCSELWAVKTDLGKPAVSDDSWPMSKAGAASSGGMKIRTFALVSSTALRQEALDFLDARFSEWQDWAAKQSKTHRERSRQKGRPQKVELGDLECIETPGPGGRLCHFGASRRFGEDQAAEESCDIRFEADGWFLAKNGSLRLLSKQVGFGDCDMNGAASETPLGLFSVGEADHVLVETDDYESEGYSILRVGEDRIETLVSVPGGGC